jgi:hypothetical protein
VKRRRSSIVGTRVRNQTELRPTEPVQDVDEFLAFLRRVHGIFGRIKRPPRRTTGDRFLL